jgi:TP901-1 family phage major tail protein
MAKHVGDNWSAQVNGSSIANMLSISPSKSTETADTTDADSSGWMEHLQTNRELTFDVEAHYDPTDSGFQAVRDAWLNNNQVSFQFTQSDGTNSDVYSGTCTITDLSHDETHDDKVTYSFSGTATGSVTHT